MVQWKRMPPEKMRMVTALHPKYDPTGKIYRDFSEGLIIVSDPVIYDTDNGLHVVHKRSVKEQNVPHMITEKLAGIYDREVTVHHKQHPRTKEHISVEFSIDASLNALFSRSFKDILKQIKLKDKAEVVGRVMQAISYKRIQVLVGSMHASLVVHQEGELWATFELNEDGYAFHRSYESDHIVRDTKGKLSKNEPYYVTTLTGKPSIKTPDYIETEVGEIHTAGKLDSLRIGLFAGISIGGTMSQVARAYSDQTLYERIENGTLRYRDLPEIVKPYVNVRVIPHHKNSL